MPRAALVLALLPCLACAAPAPAPAVLEAGGIVAVEVEWAPFRGGWVGETEIAGHSGPGYLRNRSAASAPGADVLEYPFGILGAGIYQVQIRSRIAEGSSRTEANDAFVRLVDAAGAPVAPVANDNDGKPGGWFKVYQNTTGSWTWQTSNRDHQPRALAWPLAAQGTYRLQLARRSQGFAIDRIVLWDRGRHALADERGKPDAKQAAALDAMPPSTAPDGRPVGAAPSGRR